MSAKGQNKRKALFLEAAGLLPVFFLLWMIFRGYKILPQGDTVALLNGLDAAMSCIRDGTLPCGGQVVHFPLFQYLIGLPFKLLEISNEYILITFGGLNLAAFCVSLFLFFSIGRDLQRPFGGSVAVLLLLTGYAVWYASVTFNESTAFMLFALLVYGVLKHWSIILLCIVAYLATITKEVAAPFVIYTLFLAHLSLQCSKLQKCKDYLVFSKQLLSKLAWPVIFVLLGVVTNSLFNIFRYGVYRNLSNLNPEFHTLADFIPKFFLSLFFAPAGGLFLVWFSLFSVLVIPFVFFKYFPRYALRNFCLIWLGLILMNLGLAMWYSPFGWIAWGPRLTLPILGGLGLLAVYNYKFFSGAKSRGTEWFFFMLLVATFSVSVIPNYFVLMNLNSYFGPMFSPTLTEIQSDIRPFIVQTVPPKIYMSSMFEAFSRDIIFSVSISNLKQHWDHLIYLVVCVVLVLVLPDYRKRLSFRSGKSI